MTAPHVVALVVDRDFGERAVSLSQRVHVWLIDSAMNRHVAERAWTQEHDKAVSLEAGITLFQALETDSPEEIVAKIVETIADHHGEREHDPPMTVLEIYGAHASPALREAVGAIGFSSILVDGERLVCKMEEL